MDNVDVPVNNDFNGMLLYNNPFLENAYKSL